MNTKAVTILGILAVVGVAAAIVATRSDRSETTELSASTSAAGASVFPDLAGHTQDVGEIEIKRAPQSFTVKKDGDTWKVVEKANYPARLEAVRQVVLGLSALKLVEPKTSRADQYSKLGVEDPVAPPPDSADKPVPQSVQVTLKDGSGKALASGIIGNPKWEQAGSTGASTAQLYVRKVGDKQSWLASSPTGNIDVPREPTAWLETKFADIKRDRVQSVTITQPDNSVVTVARDNQSAAFTVKDVPPGRELKDPGVAESIASALTGLSFQDVAPADSLAAAAGGGSTSDIKPGPTVVLRTFDGLIVTARSTTRDAKAWWTLAASADDALLSKLPPSATTPTDAKAEDAAATPATPKPASPASGTQEGVRKEIADLNAQWAPYAFAPADWKVRSLNSTMNDLLKEPTPAAAPGAPGPAPAPGASPAASPTPPFAPPAQPQKP